MQGDDIQHVITDGLIYGDNLSTVNFVKSERQENGRYHLKIGYRDPDFCEYSSGMQDLSFTEALELMDKWERDHLPKSTSRMKSGEFGVAGPNFRLVAKEMGILVGPEERSLHHAARVKQAARARRRVGR